jgi:hypothetical protein
MKEILSDKEKEIKRLEKDRDFFKEQATLWRNDYKKEYEENIKLKSDVDYWHHRCMKAEREKNQN